MLPRLDTAGSEPGQWRFVDPFLPNARQQFLVSFAGDDEQKPIPATAYDVVGDDQIGLVLNARTTDIVAAYEAISDFATTFTLANQRVLALINAADSQEQRSADLLNGASLLNGWLRCEESGAPHHKINEWQIDARRSGLTGAQRSEIRELRRQIVRNGGDGSLQLEVACAILLGLDEEVEDLLLGLNEEQVVQMMAWPIWKLRSRVHAAESIK